MPKKYSRSKSRGGSKVAVGGNRQQRRRSKATSVRRKPNVKKSIAAYRKRAVSFAPKQLVHGRNTSSLPVRANAPRGRPAVRMRPNVPTNIFVNYDKNVLDKRMLLDRHLAEGNLDPDDIEGLRDSDNDEDLLGTDIFKKYLDAAGGPLFKAETDMLRKHQESLRLSNQNKALNAERCRVCLDSELDIGPVKVERNDFPKHNNYNNIPSHPFRCLFTGTTGSGKTTNMIQLLIQPQYLKDYFDQIYIFSPNCKTEIEFEEIQKKNRGDVVMTEDFDEVNVNNIFQKMIRNAKKHKNDRSMMPRVLLFIDDFAGHKEVMTSDLLVKIFFMSRKYSCSTWISSQRYKCVPSNLRVNSEFHVIYEQSSMQTLLIAEELSMGRFTKDHIFNAMDKVSDTPYSFLFINARLRVHEGRFRFTYKEKLIPQGGIDADADGSEDEHESSNNDNNKKEDTRILREHDREKINSRFDS